MGKKDRLYKGMTKVLGAKTEEQNSNSMHVKLTLALLFSSLYLTAAPQSEGLAIQELRIYCQDFDQRIKHQKIETEFLQEKINALQESIASLKNAFSKETSVSSYDKRVSFIEKTQEALIADLKLLKEALNETSSSLEASQKKWATLEKQWTQDLAHVKNSLKTLLTVAQGECLPSETYIVKAGDSLEKIAHHLKIDIRKLKEMNQLSSDKIIVGQKLRIP